MEEIGRGKSGWKPKKNAGDERGWRADGKTKGVLGIFNRSTYSATARTCRGVTIEGDFATGAGTVVHLEYVPLRG
jgi:hypothetical protein